MTIHQDRVVILAGNFGKYFFSITGKIGGVAQIFELIEGDFLVDFIVFCYQNP